MHCASKPLLLLRRIPKGRVVTYGELARAAGTSPRAVGQIMRHNPDPVSYPCYKVISSDGSIGGYCGSTSGRNKKRKIALLKRDGIEVKNGRVLKKHFYVFD